MTFFIGQKVVCIAKGTWELTKKKHPGVIVPVRGNIYTVRETYRDPFFGIEGIRLREVVNSSVTFFNGTPYYIELGWLPQEFKPLEERETDISIFKKLLKPSKVTV